jgi:hypothetical protein
MACSEHAAAAGLRDGREAVPHGVDQHRHLHLVEDELKVPGIQDAHPEPISEARGITARADRPASCLTVVEQYTIT